MKKFLFLLAIFFLLPITAHAKLYQNYTYNFQIDFADRWYDDNSMQEEKIPHLITTRVNTNKSGKLGMFWIYSTDYKSADSLDNLTSKQKDKLFMKASNQLLKKYPNATIYYGQYEQIAGYNMLVIKLSATDETKTQLKIIEAITISDKKLFTFLLVTQDLTGEQEKSFFQMLSTFQNLH